MSWTAIPYHPWQIHQMLKSQGYFSSNFVLNPERHPAFTLHPSMSIPTTFCINFWTSSKEMILKKREELCPIHQQHMKQELPGKWTVLPLVFLPSRSSSLKMTYINRSSILFINSAPSINALKIICVQVFRSFSHYQLAMNVQKLSTWYIRTVSSANVFSAVQIPFFPKRCKQ